MTTAELAVLRDRVARARMAKPPVRRWSSAREAAGDAALAAIHRAERRAKERAARVPQPAPQTAKTAAKPKAVKHERRCVYCGGPPLKGRWPRVCHAHTELPKIDPAYQGELLLRGIA